jgi:hypothetical protein
LPNRAARVIAHQGYDIRSNEIRKTLNWKTLPEMRDIHKLTMMYKILNNLAPNYLRDHFEMSAIDNFYRLRNRKPCLVLPKPQTEYLKKCFACSGLKLWYTLPEDVKCSNSLSQFKKGAIIKSSASS